MKSRRSLDLTKRRLVVASFLFCFFAGIAGFPHAFVSAQDKTQITVSAAISLKDSLDQIGQKYEASHPGVKVSFNYGASGTLQRQIEQGAPVDLFFSAAEKQMDQLQEKGLVQASTRRNVVANRLVLIAPVANQTLHSFEDLSEPSVKIVALGEVTTVPAGMYAHETLDKLGLLTAVEKKAVYAKDVRAVLTYVETGNADAGIVYQSDAQGSTKVRIVATAPADSHDPLIYPAALIKGSKNPAAAQMFLVFLTGVDAQAIFAKNGFLPAENQAGMN
jgi:molybdate transport system substrate-binding protein